MWLLPLLCLVIRTQCEPTDFDPFLGSGLSFFSPGEEESFGKFPGLTFHSGGGSLLSSDYKASYLAETSNLPLYTDGKASPPQITVSQLEKDYKERLQRVAGLRSNNPTPSKPIHPGFGSSGFQGRVPRYRSEPFSSASNVEEHNPDAGKFKSINDGSASGGSSRSQPEIQTGFVPIIKGQGKRTQSTASSVLKGIPPPILTAESVSANPKPTVFKVSASVQSSSKVPSYSQQSKNATTTVLQEEKIKPRQASYSRFLNNNNDTISSSVSSSSTSESVVSRVVSRPTSFTSAQQRDILRTSSTASEDKETRLAAKKTLDINCEGSRDLGWCELGEKYPKKYVNEVVAACQDVIQRMHIEVPHSFEKLSDTSNFKAELDNSSQREARERGSHDAWSWASYFHEGSLCDSETGFLRPETAKDSSGKWNIIVQTEAVKQRVPIEMCRKTNSSCKKMLNCGLKSQCLQKYNYHLLLSLNPTQKHDCPFMKLYRFPSACVCHVE